jgi:hypothetical protein
MLKTKPFDKFESLILGKCMHTIFSVKKPIPEMIDIIEDDHLQLLFDRVFDVESGPEYIVKVIRWIIYYGHTRFIDWISV